MKFKNRISTVDWQDTYRKLKRLFYINNKLLVDIPSGTERGDINLKKGKYPIKIIYFENTGTESLNVYTRGPGIEKQTIPPALLFFE